jgi:hypothetical protein
MNNISYTTIETEHIPAILINTYDHCTGHVYLIFKNDQNKYEIILGHNEIHDNLASFGGFKNSGESLLQTICREYAEESLECIFPEDDLVNHLMHNSVMITRKSDKGQHYTIFCNVTGLKLDRKSIQVQFKNKRTNPDLTKDQKENDNIVFVSLDNIQQSVDGSVIDCDGNIQKIRNINMPAYNWFLIALKNGSINTIFN